MRSTSGLALVALLAACSGGSHSDAPSGPFQFRTEEQVPVSVQILKYGQPVAGASVALVEVYDPTVQDGDSAAEAQGRLYFEGGSGADGRCDALVSVPAEVRRVDVVVQHSGSEGPWSEPALRQRWGPFAPSSRVTASIDSLDGLTIELEDR